MHAAQKCCWSRHNVIHQAWVEAADSVILREDHCDGVGYEIYQVKWFSNYDNCFNQLLNY